MLTHAHVCSCMLMYAHVSGREHINPLWPVCGRTMRAVAEVWPRVLLLVGRDELCKILKTSPKFCDFYDIAILKFKNLRMRRAILDFGRDGRNLADGIFECWPYDIKV